MDAENDNDQPNSSSASASASSSNNSSSSNLLGHLPMLPFMRSTDDDEPDIDGEEASTAAASDGNDNDLNEEPMPLQPPVTAAAATTVAQTASASQQQPTLAPITTTASTSATANATATSSAATINSSSVGREEPMQNHQNSPPPQPPTQLQQAPNIETATPPPPTTTTQSVSASSSATLQQQFAAADLSQLDQEHHQLTAQINNRSAIADTIDASAVIVQPLEANAEHPQHPHLYPQEAANSSEELEQPPNDIQLDDNDNNDFDVDLNLQNDDVLVNATTANHQQPERQQSLSLDTTASGSSGTSSSGQQQQQQRQQTPQPPTTLPSLLQQQQQIQQQDVEELETEESKHLPSYDHHYHNNPNNYQHLHSNLYQHSSGVYPYGNRQSSELTHSNGAHNTNYNHNLFGNTMSSLADRNHGSTAGLAGHASGSNNEVVDRLKMLYPNVNENETPLPRCWSPHDKCLSIGLSQNNLRVHFKGKQSNDAASVRTAHPIPPSCGIYYFEVKIISKGKNGYMGIGLTAQQFRMNRLPGWDKQSYGYHGDDGNSFSSSGHGQSYGPTFTTGDIIGCCVNFVNNTCFYTKNGVDLGIAFRELPTKLYPTVGLQTPGEEVDANFGQEPFKFTQIEEMMKQMRDDVKTSIYDFPLPAEQGDPTTLLQRMVHSYLVHNGYSQTAEAFARQNAAQSRIYMEDMPSIRNRQKILKLVMSGKMSQAIDLTIRSYPDLLKNNENLWFMLKCRQFVEMINGSDVEYCPSSFPSFSTSANKTTNSITTQTSASNQTSVIQSTKSYQNGNGPNPSSNGSATADSIPSTSAATKTTTNTTKSSSNTTNATTITSTTTTINNAQNSTHIAVINTDIDLKTQSNLNEHCITSNDEDDPIKISKSNNDNDYINDVEMENNGHTNGNSCKNGNANIFNDSLDADEEMDIDCPLSARKNSQGIQRVLDFGRELMKMGERLERENKISDEEKQMLHDAFSLIAYSNPWAGPVGWQLCPSKRETVCRSLNSAILESLGCPKMAPLETCVAHANELLKTMSQASLGASAFVNINDVFPKN